MSLVNKRLKLLKKIKEMNEGTTIDFCLKKNKEGYKVIEIEFKNLFRDNKSFKIGVLRTKLKEKHIKELDILFNQLLRKLSKRIYEM